MSMNEQETFDRILGLIKPFARDAEALAQADSDTSILKDLKVNSARLVDIVIAFEDEFGIAIDDDEAGEVRTLGDAVRMVTTLAP